MVARDAAVPDVDRRQHEAHRDRHVVVDASPFELGKQLLPPDNRVVPGAGDVVIDHYFGLEPVGVRGVPEPPRECESLSTVSERVLEIAVLALERRRVDVAPGRVDGSDLQCKLQGRTA